MRLSSHRLSRRTRFADSNRDLKPLHPLRLLPEMDEGIDVEDSVGDDDRQRAPGPGVVDRQAEEHESD